MAYDPHDILARVVHLKVKALKNSGLGRVYTVHPHNSECYFLRLLHHEVQG